MRLCRINLILHGLSACDAQAGLDADVRLDNSLLNDLHPDLRADYVITNPPFNVDHWGADKIDDQDQRLQIGGRRGQITDGNANYMRMMR